MNDVVACDDACPIDASPTRLSRSIRLALVGLAVAGGMLALGAIFGSTSASADEAHHDGHSLLGSLTSGVADAVDRVGAGVTDVTSTVDHTVHAVTTPVAATLPAPVAKVVKAVEPVTSAVTSTLASKPVGHIVAPVARTVDQVVDSVPGARALVGSDPVSTLTTPVTGVVDSTVGNVAGTVGDTVGQLGTGVMSGNPGTPGTPGTGPSEPGSGSSAPPTESGAPAVAADGTSLDGSATAARVTWATESVALGAIGTASAAGPVADAATTVPENDTAPLGVPGDAPAGQHDPAVAPSGTSTGGSGSGGASGGGSAAADTTRGAAPTTLNTARSGLPEGDALPPSPTFDHDTSPD